MPACVARGCDQRVTAAGDRCPDCRLKWRAAQARRRRGANPIPPLPPQETALLLKCLTEASVSLDRLERERERAENERALDAMPFTEVDLWVRAVRAALTDATQVGRAWQNFVTDLKENPEWGRVVAAPMNISNNVRSRRYAAHGTILKTTGDQT